MLRTTGFLAGALLAASCGSTPTDQTPLTRDDFGAPQQMMAGETLPDTVTGIWRSRGYGWVFDIGDDAVRQYQLTDSYCFETPEASKSMTETLALDYSIYRDHPSGEHLILQLLPEDTEIWADRIDALPPACEVGTGDDPVTVFEYAAELIGEHYAFFDVRGIDWQARVEAARSNVTADMSEAALFDLLAGLIDGFSDSHTKLIGEVDGEKRRQQDGLGETLPFLREAGRETEWLIGIFVGLQQDVLDEGAQHTANDRILWGTIDNGRVGYIQILQMGGFSGVDIGDTAFRQAEFDAFDAVMDEALLAMADAEFVILDLSNNRGGYDAISRRVASRFSDAAFNGYQTYVPGTNVPTRMRQIERAEGVTYTGPVKLLTSDVTVSGGEIATLALRQLPNVTHYGKTTRGSFSTVHSKPLPNGWVIELSNEVIAAPDGQSFEETGIPPHVELEVFPLDEPVEGHRRAVLTLAGEESD